MDYSMTMWQFDYPTHYFWDWWLMRKHFHRNLQYLNYRSYLYRSLLLYVITWKFGWTCAILGVPHWFLYVAHNIFIKVPSDDVGHCPPGSWWQMRLWRLTIREDCGKETKRKSDAALEWIAQQCETTQPQVVPRWMYASSRTMGWMYTMLWNHHVAED